MGLRDWLSSDDDETDPSSSDHETDPSSSDDQGAGDELDVPRSGGDEEFPWLDYPGQGWKVPCPACDAMVTNEYTAFRQHWTDDGDCPGPQAVDEETWRELGLTPARQPSDGHGSDGSASGRTSETNPDGSDGADGGERFEPDAGDDFPFIGSDRDRMKTACPSCRQQVGNTASSFASHWRHNDGCPGPPSTRPSGVDLDRSEWNRLVEWAGSGTESGAAASTGEAAGRERSSSGDRSSAAANDGARRSASSGAGPSTYPIPDDVPNEPRVSVDYDALTDEEPIGGGGSADVTRARLPTSGSRVTLAIKRPRVAGTLHTDAIERLLSEAETWAKVDGHDHVVGVVDYGAKPMPWIAMEYMDGGHLGERSGEMELPQALWTALAVTKGVRHAHRRGIAHLDLTPQNVLFRSVEGAWDVPKVADWGLSRHLLEQTKTVDGMSVEYAAPEQFDEDYGAADDITDVYQLGTVFYELFTGRPPFQGKPFEVIDMVRTDRPTPPSEVAAVPEALDEILLTALAKEKGDRYDDIIYLRDDLRALFDSW